MRQLTDTPATARRAHAVRARRYIHRSLESAGENRVDWSGWGGRTGVQAAVEVVASSLRRDHRRVVLSDAAIQGVGAAGYRTTATGDASGREHVRPTACVGRERS